jgi:hypothetical protein
MQQGISSTHLKKGFCMGRKKTNVRRKYRNAQRSKGKYEGK